MIKSYFLRTQRIKKGVRLNSGKAGAELKYVEDMKLLPEHCFYRDRIIARVERVVE